MPALSGSNNCGTPAETETYSNLAVSADWAIYPAANNQYLLEGAVSGALLVGTSDGTTYTFKGVETQEDKSMAPFTMTLTSTVVLKMSAAGFTGTIKQEESCTSPGNANCTTGPAGMMNTADYDCSAQTTVDGVPEGTVQSQVLNHSAGDGTLFLL